MVISEVLLGFGAVCEGSRNIVMRGEGDESEKIMMTCDTTLTGSHKIQETNRDKPIFFGFGSHHNI